MELHRPIALLGTDNLLYYRLLPLLESHLQVPVDLFDEKEGELVVGKNTYPVHSFQTIDEKKYGVFVLLNQRKYPLSFDEIAKNGGIICDIYHAFPLPKETPFLDVEIDSEDIYSNGAYFVLANPLTSILGRALRPFHQCFELEKVVVTGCMTPTIKGKRYWQEYLQASTFQIHGKGSLYENLLPLTNLDSDGYGQLEKTLIQELKRAFHLPKLEINPTLFFGPIPHTVTFSVSVICKEKIDEKRLIQQIEQEKNLLYVPIIDAEAIHGGEKIAISRVKKDLDCEYTYNMLVHGDPLWVLSYHILKFIQVKYESL